MAVCVCVCVSGPESPIQLMSSERCHRELNVMRFLNVPPNGVSSQTATLGKKRHHGAARSPDRQRSENADGLSPVEKGGEGNSSLRLFSCAYPGGSARILTAAVTSRLPRSELDLTGERS